MRTLLLLLALTPLAWGSPVPPGTTQLILVRTSGWNAAAGELLRYERKSSGPWRRQGEAVPVQTGRNGLGWGRGLHPEGPPSDPRKAEGDGRAPAGVFRISTMFGSESAPTAAFPFLPVTSTMVGVDDPRSRHYNEIVDKARVTPDWVSAERMLIPDYRLGLVVDHNRPQPVPGAGSCIFMHLWETPDTATSGCTVTDYASLLTVCQWLRSEAHPVLVQLPEDRYRSLRKPWDLP